MTKKVDKKRKIFILDTSVLLYDARSIHSFPGNDVVLPLVVLDELDRFKERKGTVGENARYVNRYLDELRKNGNSESNVYEKGLRLKDEKLSNIFCIGEDLETLKNLNN